MFDKVRSKVAALLEPEEFISFTTDLLSSVAQDSYLRFTTHFISTSTLHLCLHACPFDEQHTGMHIASKLTSCFEQWKVVNKVQVIVRDSGSNFVAGLRNAALPNFSCMAHTLQLVICDGCLAQKDVSDLLAVGRRIVSFYKCSNVAYKTLQNLKEQLKLPEHRLIQDVPTRWNSSFYMLQRILEQRVALTVVNAEVNVPAELHNSQWTLADKVVKLLQIFEEATREVCGNYSSTALVIPIVNSIYRALEVSEDDWRIMSMKKEMLQSLKQRYDRMESNSFYCLATVLDPSFKLLVFSSASSAAFCKQMLIAEYETLTMSDDTDALDKESETSGPSPKKICDSLSSLLWKYFGELTQEKSDSDNSALSPKSVVNAYLKEGTVPMKSDPLEHWKDPDHCGTWPVLATLAQRFLSAPAASASSEWLFSTPANICTDSRNRLCEEKLEMLLFLNKNLTMLDFDY